MLGSFFEIYERYITAATYDDDNDDNDVDDDCHDQEEEIVTMTIVLYFS